MDDETLANQSGAGSVVSSVKTPSNHLGAGAFEHSETVVNEGIHAPSRFAPLNEHDLSGTTLGAYQLVRKIAEGGMGEVYEAIQTKLARKVALKVLTDRLSARPEFIRRFEREAKAAAVLNHPNVVQVYDFGEANGQRYLVMEYVEGEDLAEYIRCNGKLTIAEGLAVVEQAAHALKAAHEKSIIHRDIKPANLMLTTDGIVKVSDLGLAKILTDDSEVTATGVGIGSPHFLAPEQADDARRADHRADMYALGITLLYLVTGKKPYEGASVFSVVLAHAQRPLPSGLELGTELPDAIEAFIRRLAAKNPADRYPDYDTLLADLDRVKAGFAPVQRIGHQAATGWASNVPLRIGMAGLLVVAVSGVLMWPRLKGGPLRGAVQPALKSDTPQLGRGQPLPVALRRLAPGAPQPTPLPSPERIQPPELAKATDSVLPGVQSGLRSPFPALPLPDRSPLRDGPLSSMMAEAEAFAKANPKRFVKIIDRYWQLQRKAAGTPREAEINQQLETWVLTHQLTAYETIDTYKQKMLSLLQARKVQEAYDVWKDFPMDLRTPEIDQQIEQVLRQHMPPGLTLNSPGIRPVRQ